MFLFESYSHHPSNRFYPISLLISNSILKFFRSPENFFPGDRLPNQSDLCHQINRNILLFSFPITIIVQLIKYVKNPETRERMEEKAAETPTIDDEPYSDPEEYPH